MFIGRSRQPRRSDSLSERDLEGISSSVTRGIQEAARLQAHQQAGWSLGKALLLITFMAVIVTEASYDSWSYVHRPPKPMALRAQFGEGTSLTADLAATTSTFLVQRVTGVSEVVGGAVPVEVKVHLSAPDCQRLAEAVGTACEGNVLAIEEPGIKVVFEPPGGVVGVAVNIETTNVQRMTLSRDSAEKRVGVALESPQATDAGALRGVAIIDIPKSPGTTVSIRRFDDSLVGSASLDPALTDKIVLRFVRTPSASPSGQGDTEEKKDPTSYFTLAYASEEPPIDVEAAVSGLSLKETEGALDVGSARYTLIGRDDLELALSGALGPRIDGRAINIAGKAESVRRNTAQLLQRQYAASTVSDSFAGGLFVLLLTLSPIVLPAVLPVLLASIGRSLRKLRRGFR